MPPYEIELTEDAKADLGWYRALEQKTVLSQIKQQVRHEPLAETKNRKMLRHSPLAPWELRVGKYCVFYHVLEGSAIASVVANMSRSFWPLVMPIGRNAGQGRTHGVTTSALLRCLKELATRKL